MKRKTGKVIWICDW